MVAMRTNSFLIRAIDGLSRTIIALIPTIPSIPSLPVDATVLPGSIYFYTLKTVRFTETNRMLSIRWSVATLPHAIPLHFAGPKTREMQSGQRKNVLCPL